MSNFNKIFKGGAKYVDNVAELTADFAKKFGDDLAEGLADITRKSVRDGKTLVGTATDMAEVIVKKEGVSLADAFKKLANKGDDLFDDGFKAVLENARIAAKQADGSAGKLGKIVKACTGSGKGVAGCAGLAGTAAYAGVWWNQETVQAKRRSACRGMCMPSNTDDFVGTAFSDVDKSQINFRTLDDVKTMFPEATSDTLNDYPLCQDTSDINNLADCKAKCDTECDEEHPKSGLFNKFIADAGKILDAAADATGLKEFWEKKKTAIIIVFVTVVVLIAIGLVLKYMPKKKPYQMPPSMAYY